MVNIFNPQGQGSAKTNQYCCPRLCFFCPIIFHRHILLVKPCGLETLVKNLWMNILCYKLMISKERGQFHTE